jgi:pentatricopeptide repeat protein
MSVGVTSDPRTSADTQGRRLESWKEVAAYLGRDITTVRRWEKREALPVHRIHHSRLGSVYAYTAELDAWRNDRAAGAANGGIGATQAPQTVSRVWAVITLAALGLVLAGGLAWRWRQRSTELPTSAGSRIRSLAVLPLENLSGNPDQNYLADGMTEALIGRLSTIQGLRVISRTSSMQFKAARSSEPEIARKLNVQAVVEGSVIRSGDRIRVTAQLIQGDTDMHLWSGTFDRELRDVLSLESEVAQSIARQIEVAVTGQERSRLVAVRPVSPEVYESYLKGRFELNKGTRAGLQEALRQFQAALDADSTFAPAYAGLAGAHLELGTVFYGEPPYEVRPKVFAAAGKALELDPQLVEAHVVLAQTLASEWRWPEAEAEYKRAIELSPSDAGAHAGFAHWFLCQDRTQEALSWARRAQELDPLALHGIEIGWILFQAHRYDEAIRELRTVLIIEPESPSALWYLGFALIGAEQFDEAIQILERAASVSHRSSAVLGVLVRAYARAGRRAEALQVLDELHRRRKVGYVPPAAFLNAYLGLGDTEQAFTWLGRAADERSNIMQFLKVHPFFDPLRGDPRFAAFLRRANFQ